MKKQLYFIIAAALVSMSVVSCSEKLVSGDVKFNATAPQEASWSGKEVIAISVDGATPINVNATEGKTVNVTSTLTDCHSSAPVLAVSPYTTSGSGINSFTSTALEISIPASQKSRDGFPDAEAQLLLSSTSYSDGLPTTMNLPFQSILATGKLVVANAPEAIKSAKLKFSKNVAGTYTYLVAEKSFTEKSASAEMTLKGGADGVMYFTCAPVNTDVSLELTGESTGIVYKTSASVNLQAGNVTEIKADLKGSVKLYLVGSAINKETAAEAVAMTDNGDGTFTWTGQMAAGSEYKLIFDQTNLTPALTVGDAFNKIKYSTKATATPFEIAKAGKYKITVYLAQAHIQVQRIFDHVLADNNNESPMCEEYDNPTMISECGNTWTSLVGPFLHNHYFNVFDVNEEFKLSGKNSFHVQVFGQAPGWNQGHIFRSADYKQPYAVNGKTYTVSMQFMYEGAKDTENIKFGIEGALGTGSRTNTTITLERGVPYQYSVDMVADGTWGGCVNIFISFDLVSVDEGTPMEFYMDAVNIGYDD